MFTTKEILSTIDMIKNQCLDIRTVTMGISLRDCATDDAKKTINKIKDKIRFRAENLVKTGEQI